MKQKLLLLIPTLLLMLNVNAQNHVWDFGNDTTNWPVNSGTTSNTTIDGLNLIAGGSTVGAISSSANSFSDGFTSVNMMSLAAATGAPAPTKRGLSFPVNGPCTVSLWVFTSSTNRTASISDGTNVLASYTSASPSPYKTILTANYSGGPGTIYVYTNNTMNLAKLAVSNSLATTDVTANKSVTISAANNQVYLSNIKSATTISVYSITGTKIKTIETTDDTSFYLQSGLWIANIKSAEGTKSVKFIVH
jgi:hypothetical protein